MEGHIGQEPAQIALIGEFSSIHTTDKLEHNWSNYTCVSLPVHGARNLQNKKKGTLSGC